MSRASSSRILQVGLFVSFAILVLVMTVWQSRRKSRMYLLEQSVDSLPDTLRIVTTYGSTTYFQYKGEDMGYEFELARLFADSLGLPYRLIVAHNAEAMLQMIDSGMADLCISPQPMTVSGKQRFRYVGQEEKNGLVLVQRREPKDSLVTSTTELVGRTITVPRGTRYAERLKHLNEELGGGVDSVILSGDTVTIEDLIDYVAEDKYALTIADEGLARLGRTYHRGLDISLEVGFQQRLFWVTNPDRTALADAIDSLALTIPREEAYRTIYKRYFERSKREDEYEELQTTSARKSHRRPIKPGDLSPYDHLFKKEAERLGWPWQLLASIAYRESTYRAEVIGWSGALGLMGIMPSTGRIYGASKEQLLDAEVSVRVSVSILMATRRTLGITGDEREEMKLALAAYNAGIGHVLDAMRLCEKYGDNPHVWEGNVEKYIRLKSEPKYYNDPVCRSGYLRGKETISYVQKVMSRYDSYH